MFNRFTDKGSKYSSFWRSDFDTSSIFDDLEDTIITIKQLKRGLEPIRMARVIYGGLD